MKNIKIIILLFLILSSYSQRFNPNTIVTIYNKEGQPLCDGVIIADRFVISSPGICYFNKDNQPSYISSFHSSTRNKIINYKLVYKYNPYHRLLLIKVDKGFEVKDFSSITPSDRILKTSYPKSFTSFTCNQEILINETSDKLSEEGVGVDLSNVSYSLEDDYIFLKDKGRLKKNDHEQAKHFLWRVCNDVYTLYGIYESGNRYIFTSPFDSIIVIDIIYAIQEDESVDEREVSFTDIPLLHDESVNQYIKKVLNNKWIEVNDHKYSIPFRNEKLTEFPCGYKLTLSAIFLHKYHDPEIKFAVFYFNCDINFQCFNILGKTFSDHATFGYRSIETNLIMIVDPAISDKAFSINEIFNGQKMLDTKKYDLLFLLPRLHYIVSVYRPIFFYFVFLLQQPFAINDKLEKFILSTNEKCLELN